MINKNVDPLFSLLNILKLSVFYLYTCIYCIHAVQFTNSFIPLKLSIRKIPSTKATQGMILLVILGWQFHLPSSLTRQANFTSA